MIKKDHSLFHARLDSVKLTSEDEKDSIHSILTDKIEQKNIENALLFLTSCG